MNKGIVGAIALASITLLLVMASLLLFSVPMVLANSTDNLTTYVTVTGVAPTVGAITCVPAVLTPTAGNDTIVRCYATISDQNGWANIDQSTLNVNIWLTGLVGGADDLNSHYSNGTGSNAAEDCTWSGQSGEDIDVSCNFTTKCYIDPGAGSWDVNFSVQDTESKQGSNTTTWSVNGILGLDVVEGVINFGGAALSEEKNTTVTIHNICNSPIDLRMAETNGTAGELICDGAGSNNITTDNANDGVRYNKTVTDLWAGMEKLTGSNYDFAHWDQGYYNASGTTPGTESATLYWTIRVPSTAVSGTCSGITRFTVIDDA